MRIYEVSHIGADDNFHSEFFTSKILAQKVHAKLKKHEAKVKRDQDDPDFDWDEDHVIKGVNDIFKFDCDISKSGILRMLNNRFSEKSG